MPLDYLEPKAAPDGRDMRIAGRAYLRTCIAAVTLALGASIAAGAHPASPWHWLAGFGLWEVAYYVLHRFVLHRVGSVLGGLDNHRRHHADPEDPAEIVFRLRESLPVLALVGLLLGLLAPLGVALRLFAGFAVGYILYETVHLLTHSGVTHTRPREQMPRWRWLLVRNHWSHHFEDAHRRFGTVTPIFDWLLFTR